MTIRERVMVFAIGFVLFMLGGAAGDAVTEKNAVAAFLVKHGLSAFEMPAFVFTLVVSACVMALGGVAMILAFIAEHGEVEQ